MDIYHLQNLKSVPPTHEERVDIGNIKVNMIPCVYERAREFLEQIKNPYAFRCGEIAVNVVFCPEGKLLKDMAISYLSSQKSINANN